MINPSKITNFKRTKAELEEFVLFTIIVAGKNAVVQAKKLEAFLFNAQLMGLTPFKWLKHLIGLGDKHLLNAMKANGLGQYTRLLSAFKQVVELEGKLHTCTVEDLEAIKGLGNKTSRFFLTHSRPNQNFAVLDTHVLKYLRSKGYDAPKSTPSKKKYAELERIFLKLCEESGKTAATLDLEIWNHYATKI